MSGFSGGPRVQAPKQMTTTTVTTVTGTAWTDTAVTLSITPTSTLHKIKVSFAASGSHTSNSAGFWVKLVRVVGGTPTDIGVPALTQNNSAAPNVAPAGLVFIDAPATTATVTYKIQLKCNIAANDAVLPLAGTGAVLILEEIAP